MKTLMNRFDFLSLSLLLFLFSAHASEPEFQPVATKVTGNIYAIIGPLDQRSEANNGLNSNLGFIVTDSGVILIDSGASRIGAQLIEKAVRKITKTPIKWVINTGSQDHRWLGNDYFARHGAKIIALSRTAKTQKEYARQQLGILKRFLGKKLKGTKPLPATTTYDGNKASLKLGGETLILQYTDAHFPGDSWVWLPKHRVIFTGDLVFVDRVFALLPSSSVRNGQKAFHAMEALSPRFIVPGHGRVSDLKKARRECGDYYDFLVNTIGKAAQDMESMDEVLNRYTHLPAFEHLRHFKTLHRTNMSRAYLEFENM